MVKENNFIIYIPGLFTTSLLKGNDIIWPFDNIQYMKIYFNYYIKEPIEQLFNKDGNIENTKDIVNEYLYKLEDRNLVPGTLRTDHTTNIIELIKDISENNYYIFTYDWRQCFDKTIEKLSKEIESLDVADKNITIISHSAGGIIAYKYINDIEKYKNNNNFNKINKYITIGCPIQGSIKALSYLLGLSKGSILHSSNVKNILNNGFFKSVFELLPSNIHNLFFYKNTKTLLQEKELVNLLLINGFDENTLQSSIQFRKNINNLQQNDSVDFLFIVGINNKQSMCTSFSVNRETKEIECVFDIGAGDGAVLVNEASLDISKNFRTRYVIGKHSYLTEIDDTLSILKQELLFENNTQYMVISKVIKQPSPADKTIEFLLFLYKNKEDYLVKDISSESIYFSQKTDHKDITNSIKKNKKNNSFYFKTVNLYGVLKMKNVHMKIISFDKNNGEKGENNENTEVLFFKKLFIELEKPNHDNLF